MQHYRQDEGCHMVVSFVGDLWDFSYRTLRLRYAEIANIRLAVDVNFRIYTHIHIQRFYVDIHRRLCMGTWTYVHPNRPRCSCPHSYSIPQETIPHLLSPQAVSPSSSRPTVRIPIPSTWYKISLPQPTNHQLVLFSSQVNVYLIFVF